MERLIKIKVMLKGKKEHISGYRKALYLDSDRREF